MKILKVVDTRDYEEVADGKWAPIPGSGNARECDRCGRLHEVHAYVETTGGETMVVGTGCMGLGPDVARKLATKAATFARLAAEREHLLDQRVEREAAEREVAAMVPPPVEYRVAKWGKIVAVGNAEANYQPSFQERPATQADIQQAIRMAEAHWRFDVLRAVTKAPSLRDIDDRLEALDRRLSRSQKA